MGLNISTEDPTAPSKEEQFLHDLAIPLTTLKLNLDLMAEHYQHDSCLQRLRMSYEQIDLMLKTQRSYSFARMSKCKLSRIIAESVVLFSDVFKKDAIETSTSLRADIIIPDHSAILRRVMINLLKNSIEALKQEQGIRRLKITTYTLGKGLCIKVYNSGRGFPKDLMAYLGKYQITSKPNGNGLGLLNVNKIVTQVFKGKVAFVNHRQGGAVVRIYLPL